MNQNERLDYLLQALISESEDYGSLRTDTEEEHKRILLRSLMNVRLPRQTPDKVLKIQDAYLTQRNEEKGIVHIQDIPEIEKGISIWQGDITRLEADAIVNAANNQMLGCFVPMHTCIDNCIHTYAGMQLRAECDRKMRQLRHQYGEDYVQPTAVPMITDAYNLPARKVIHIVGPIVSGNVTAKHEEELAACYRNTLDLCAGYNLKSVAFCCISTGVFRFPNERAAEIAVQTVKEWLNHNNGKIERVIFNVYKDEDKEIYEQLLA